MTRRTTLTAVLLTVALPAVLVYAQDEPTPPPLPQAETFDVLIDGDEGTPPQPYEVAVEQDVLVADDETPPPPTPPSDDARPRKEERRRVIIQRRGDRAEPGQPDVLMFNEGLPPPSIPPNSAWLGVRLSPVPAALAYHLGIADTGAMVANVFEGSPAEKAGLDRYDVIVRADGKSVAGGMEAVQKFSENVRDKKPGDTLELTIFSQGKEKSLRIELGKSLSDWSSTKPKYEDDPDVALQREFGLRGKIMRPGPGGTWTVEELDQFPMFRKQLEKELRHEHGDEPADVLIPAPPHEQGQQVAVRVDKDGTTIRVQRDLKDGPITVERYKAGDKQVAKKQATYDNMDELRKADEEAFDLLKSAGQPQQPRIKVLPPAKPGPSPYVMPMPPQAPAAPVTPQYRKPEAGKRDEARREWERGFFQGPLKDARPREIAPPAQPREAKTRFEVAADGKITVHFRDEDAEISRTYNSAEELRDKAPRLAKQFDRLQERMSAGD